MPERRFKTYNRSLLGLIEQCDKGEWCKTEEAKAYYSNIIDEELKESLELAKENTKLSVTLCNRTEYFKNRVIGLSLAFSLSLILNIVHWVS